MGAVGPTTCWPRFRLLVRVSTGPPCTEGRELDFPTRPSHFRSTGCCVAHHRNHGHHPRQAPPASGEGPQARHAGAAQAGLDPRARCRRPRRSSPRRAAILREHGLRHGVRGGRLPQHRRVLGGPARHHDDHGRHLHARLRLLQRAARACRARSIRKSPRTSPKRWPKLGLRSHRHHLGRSRRSGRRRRRAFRGHHPRHPRAHAHDHDRGADAGLPAQGRRARDGRGGGARRLQPQPRDGAVALSQDPARRALLPLASGCCSG